MGSLSEVDAFLKRYPDVAGIDVILTDAHGIGRGKIIRRHELAGLYRDGRGMPDTLFAQDVTGDDVDAVLPLFSDGGGDCRCVPVPGTLGFLPATGRGIVLVTMRDAGGSPHHSDPRAALIRQVDRARSAGFSPMGAMELEFYLLDAQSPREPASAPLTGRRPVTTNTMSVDELDEMSPFFDAVYAGAEALNLPFEALISEYGRGQYELTLRYGPLDRAADDIILAKRLIRTTARRYGMEACFMAKPFGHMSGSGMHLHLSLADAAGDNLFADGADGGLAPAMLHAIGGIRGQIREAMLIIAPFLNSWRRFSSATYSPAETTWGREDRNVALRVPQGAPATRHFEQRLGGVDANPYLLAAVTLGAALDGIAAKTDPGAEGISDDVPALPTSWGEAIEAFAASDAMRRHLGDRLHTGFTAIKRAEYDRLAREVTDVEWRYYGFNV